MSSRTPTLLPVDPALQRRLDTVPRFTEDVGRWHRIHPEAGIPSRWRKTTHPHADITAAEEH